NSKAKHTAGNSSHSGAAGTGRILTHGGNFPMVKSIAVMGAFVFLVLSFGKSGTESSRKHAEDGSPHTPVLWRQPDDISSRDLFWGPGGKEHAPHGRFTFQKEDSAGSSPKFDVVDQDGVRWRVKLGPEARPETAASRLLWAVGYFTNED